MDRLKQPKILPYEFGFEYWPEFHVLPADGLKVLDLKSMLPVKVSSLSSHEAVNARGEPCIVWEAIELTPFQQAPLFEFKNEQWYVAMSLTYCTHEPDEGGYMDCVTIILDNFLVSTDEFIRLIKANQK